MTEDTGSDAKAVRRVDGRQGAGGTPKYEGTNGNDLRYTRTGHIRSFYLLELGKTCLEIRQIDPRIAEYRLCMLAQIGHEISPDEIRKGNSYRLMRYRRDNRRLYSNDIQDLQFNIFNPKDSDTDLKFDMMMTDRELQGFQLFC